MFETHLPDEMGADAFVKLSGGFSESILIQQGENYPSPSLYIYTNFMPNNLLDNIRADTPLKNGQLTRGNVTCGSGAPNSN